MSISRKLEWKSDIQFNHQQLYRDAPIFSNMEVEGVGEDAFLKLSKKSNNDDDILYQTIGDFSLSDPTKITVADNTAKLKSGTGIDVNFPFVDPANYDVSDADEIGVSGGNAKLNGINANDIHVHYHLNESAGSNVADSSGNGRDGTCLNMEDVDWQAGKLNNCLYFDGVNESVDCGNIADFERDENCSFECWIQTSNKSMDVMTRYKGGTGWIIFVSSSGKLYVTFRNSAGVNEASRYGNTILDDGAWHHIVVTYDGSSSNTGITIYLDGLDDTDNTSGVNTLTSTIKTTGNMNIAGRDGSASFLGKIDEVVVYEKELSSDEVAFRYNAGSGIEQAGYSVNHPYITNKTGVSFTAKLTSFVETATKPNGTQVKYYISDDDGVTKEYWNGSIWTTSDGSYAQSSLATDIHANLISWSSNGVFKWYAVLDSNGGIDTPLLDNLYIQSPSDYPTDDNLYIDTTDLSQIAPSDIFAWLSATITNNLPAGTYIALLVSVDGRSTWLTLSGGVWTATGSPTLRVSGTSISDFETNFADIPLVNGTLNMRLFLKTDDMIVTPSVDGINAISDAGYENTGYYISTNYYPANYFTGIIFRNLTYDIETPAGTTLKVYAKFFPEDAIDTKESDYVEYANDYDIDFCDGQFVQWKIEVTSDGENTAKLNSIEFDFYSVMGICEIIRRIETNRWKIDTVNNQMIFYDDDGVTPLYTFDLKDANGDPTSLSPYERIPT